MRRLQGLPVFRAPDSLEPFVYWRKVGHGKSPFAFSVFPGILRFRMLNTYGTWLFEEKDGWRLAHFFVAPVFPLLFGGFLSKMVDPKTDSKSLYGCHSPYAQDIGVMSRVCRQITVPLGAERNESKEVHLGRKRVRNNQNRGHLNQLEGADADRADLFFSNLSRGFVQRTSVAFASGTSPVTREDFFSRGAEALDLLHHSFALVARRN